MSKRGGAEREGEPAAKAPRLDDEDEGYEDASEDDAQAPASEGQSGEDNQLLSILRMHFEAGSRDGRSWKTLMEMLDLPLPSVLLDAVVEQIDGDDTLSHKDKADAFAAFSTDALQRLAVKKGRERIGDFNTVEDVCKLLKEKKSVLVLTGAGVSVNAGIPDFRSENGLYSIIGTDYPELPQPEAMFDIKFFQTDPRPFFTLAKELWPANYKPTFSHYFIRTLEQKGILLRNYTQNIDTLEDAAGIKKVLQCHGSFASASCVTCKRKYAKGDIESVVMKKRVPLCPVCHPGQDKDEQTDKVPSESTKKEWASDDIRGVIKPDIVFFGEDLGDKFRHAIDQDSDKVDLVIVIGSSLTVHPVAGILRVLPAKAPVVLINKTPLRGMDEFDVELIGDCDEILSYLTQKLEWEVEKGEGGEKKGEEEKKEPSITSEGYCHYFGEAGMAAMKGEDGEGEEEEEEEGVGDIVVEVDEGESKDEEEEDEEEGEGGGPKTLVEIVE